MKKPLFLLIILLAGLRLSAQVSGSVLDKNSGKPLPGANAVLQRLPDSATAASAITDAQGRYVFSNVKRGRYVLRITFVGMATSRQALEVSDQPVRMAPVYLQESATTLGEVTIAGKVPQAVQKGDTTEMNAGAFKVNRDASAEDLIQKMPGITVDNGKVQAHGEDVKQVLVDGRPFFGNDPTAALRNLPAEVIDKIQVFDQQSEQAIFTGFDDGNTSKTLNIVTRISMRNGEFGKAYAGYGLDDKYQAGGNYNNFSGDRRISVLGQSNNVNQQNFASEDLLGVVGSNAGGGFRGGMGGGMRGGRGGGGGGGGMGGGGFGGGGQGGGDANSFLVQQQGGITTTHAAGLNYSDKWGDKIKVSGSYFFNNANNENNQNLHRQYITPALSKQEYTETSTAASHNTNHRVNMRLEYTIDSFNSIVIRPRLTWQENNGDAQVYGTTRVPAKQLNETTNDNRSNQSAANLSNELLWRHRFRKQGRTVSAGITTSYNDKNGTSFLDAQTRYFNTTNDTDFFEQTSRLDANGWGLSSNLMYTEPVSRESQLMLNYTGSFQQNASDKQTFDFSAADQRYSILDTLLSNSYRNDYVTHQGGVGYRYQKDKWQLMARVGYQYATLGGDQRFPVAGKLSRDFQDVLPSLMLRYNFSRQVNLRVNYRTMTNPPSIDQLQAVVNNTNPLQLSRGNPGLKQEYRHSIAIRLAAPDPAKSTTLFALVNADVSNNYVGNSTIIATRDTVLSQSITLQRGAQLTQPVNLDGRYTVRTFLTYGRPLGILKTNLNFNLSGSFSHTPGLINGEKNFSNTQTYGLGLVLSSNISEKLDFTIGSTANLSYVRNSLRSDLNTNYYNQSSRVKLNWVIWKGFVFNTEVVHQYNSGLSASYNQSFVFWNAAIAKKLFAQQQGDIRLSVFDLLHQNTSIQRNVTDVYLEDVQTNVLQRYFMLTFTYTFRKYRPAGK